MNIWTAILFALSCCIMLSLLLYPFAAWLRSFLFPKPIRASGDFIRPVSIIIAAYNEERYIRQKLESFLDPREWIKGSEIIVVSAGSNDATNSILDEFMKTGVLKVIKHPTPISKIRAVNIAVSHASHYLLVFSDTRQRMKLHSVKKLLANFNDSEVGTVVAVLEDHNSGNGYSFSRRLLNFCCCCDSKAGSGLNVYGALYAQRRELFREFPTDLLFDDLFTVVSTIVQGKRLVQEPEAVIYDLPFHTYYGPERIRRLARGLLIFFFMQYKLILKMPLDDMLRFLVFKYAKLLLPWASLAFACICCYWLSSSQLLVAASLLMFLLCVPFTRKLILLAIRVNFYFMSASLSFIFLKERSVNWQQLNTTNA